MHKPKFTLSSFPTSLFPTPPHAPLHFELMLKSLYKGEHMWLQTAFSSTHHFSKEAKIMKNGLSRSHLSNLGMLSSACIDFCDLSNVCIPGTWYHLLNYF